jgi:hypothetical protein
VTRLRPDQLRSHRWFGVDDLRGFGHRSRAKQAGFGPEDYAGKPVVAILNTWSDLNPCHLHFRLRADEVKRGVWQAGGCSSWYIDSRSGKNTLLWPSTTLDFWRRTKFVRSSDYTFE